MVTHVETTGQVVTYDDLIHAATDIKKETDATPINPDPIIAAADASEIATIERAAEVRAPGVVVGGWRGSPVRVGRLPSMGW